MAFTPAYRDGGGAIEAREFYIPTATVIEKGEVVGFTLGTGVVALGAAGTDFDDGVLGVAAEAHPANSGTSIKVYCDPNIVFKVVPRTESTTTNGDATSWIDSSLTAANDVFNGGHIVITDTNDVDGFKVGDVLTITDFANSGGDCTVSGAGGTIAAGMKGYIYPGPLAVTCYGFDLDGDGTNLDMDTAGGESFVITDVQWDPAKKEATVFGKFRVHLFGNSVVDPSASA